MSVIHSPPLSIEWLDASNGGQRFCFQDSDPITLSFGLGVVDTFWSEIESGQFDVEFQVWQAGFRRYYFRKVVGVDEFPWTMNQRIWLGVALGRASQIHRQVGVYCFRPSVIIRRFGQGPFIPPDFATSLHDYCFMIDNFGPQNPWSFDSEQLVGGDGQSGPPE
jgi:hypothetical protein